MFRSNRDRLRKPKTKILDNVTDDLNKQSKPSKQRDSPSTAPAPAPVPGDRFDILVREDEIKNIYNNFKFYENKSKHNNLTLAEYRKINNDIDQMKQNLPKKSKNYVRVKKI